MECRYSEYKYTHPMRSARVFRKVNIVECQGNGWPHARAMGDGSASADLLPDEEVDEDLADDMAGVEPVDTSEGVHALLTKTP
jgi:hypothetical protein